MSIAAGGEAALGVAHRRRRVVVAERAEVAVPVDQRDAHRERLGHADERVVDGAVAVRVELAHDVADDACALHVRPVGAQAHLGHR